MSEAKSSLPAKAPPYRWVVLVVFMLVGLMNQIFWINFASINKEVADHYLVLPTDVDLLSLCFMVVYLVVGPFASIIIDSRGFRVGVSIGAILTGGFGFLRYFASDNFILLLIFQIGVAAGQPFLYNAISKMAARWFPPEERATAAGLANLGFFVGILLGFVLPAALLPLGFQTMLLILGSSGIVAAVLFLIYGKDHPEIPYGETARIPMKDIFRDLKRLLKIRIAQVLAVMTLIGVGIFNAVSTFIQYISGVYPVSVDDAALLGGLVIICGIIGSLFLPAISDKFFKAGKPYARKLFPLLGLAIAVPVSIGIGISTDFTIIMILMAILGFFTLPTMAIGMQWIAEETTPIPESESNNLLMYTGQIGGILLLLIVPVLFNIFPDGLTPQYTPEGILIPFYASAMYFFAVLYAIAVILLLVIRTTKKTHPK